MSKLGATWNFNDPMEYLRRVREQEFPPLIITVAITGGLHGAETNPNLPETPEEQAKSTFEAYEAGASIVHVHARDPKTGYATASSNLGDYREVNRRIRELCSDIIINNTTGGGPRLTMEERIRSLEANPEMASLNMGPTAFRIRFKKRQPPLSGRPEDFIFDDVLPFGSYKETEFIAKKMLQMKIKPEFEMWAPGYVGFMEFYNLIDKELVKPPYLIQFIMGAALMATPQSLLNCIGMVPQNSLINVLGLAQHQLPMTTLAILLGCHIRVGMEDNVYYKRGELCKSNAQLVKRAVRIAKELNRKIATPSEAREMLGISKTPHRF